MTKRNSSDIFESLGEALRPIQDFKGFKSAQLRYDNEGPEDYGQLDEPASSAEECQAFDAYKFAMKLAVDALNHQLEIYKKHKNNDVVHSIKCDIEEITIEVARREIKII